MKKLLSAIAVSALLAGPAVADDLEGRIGASREAVKGFFGTLKGELVTALKDGGPVAAIAVCNEKAPAIAAETSAQKGMKIGRTSLKLRNAGNAPDAWEQAVLEKFEARKAAGEDVTKMEFSEVVAMDGKQVFRYMKAIPTAEKPCLVCHGENIPEPVKAKLDELYPQDQARGYQAGDIRGAFTIMQEM